MNITIKGLRVSILLVAIYASLYLIPFNQYLLEQFHQQFHNLVDKIYPREKKGLAVIISYAITFLSFILFMYYKSEQKRMFLGIIIALSFFPIIGIVCEKETGSITTTQEFFIKAWKLISVLTIGFDFIRIRKFNGGN